MAKKIHCPRCNGYGYKKELVKHPDPVQGTLLGRKLWMDRKRFRCNGKGMINEPGWAGKALEYMFPWRVE